MNKLTDAILKFGRCVHLAVVSTLQHDGMEHAGYLAFLSLLAMFPFLVFLTAIVGVLGQGIAGADLINNLLSALPPHVADALRPRIMEIISGPPNGLLTLSILGAIWTASGAVEGMRTVLNRAYQVRTLPAYWLRRLLSILQLFLFTSIMLASILLMVIIPFTLHHIASLIDVQFIDSYQNYWSRLAFLFTLAVTYIAVCGIYYLLPNIKQRFITVAPGALIVVLFWSGAAQLFSLYLADFNQMDVIYGSLGGIIATLIFFYICNIIFIFGAEFNHQIVDMLGLHMVERRQIPESGD